MNGFVFVWTVCPTSNSNTPHFCFHGEFFVYLCHVYVGSFSYMSHAALCGEFSLTSHALSFGAPHVV